MTIPTENDHFACKEMKCVPDVYHSSEMGYVCGLSLSMLLLLLPLTDANLNNAVHFTPIPKPLQCHEIKKFYFRSPVECALLCASDLYSCAGYVHSRNERSRFHCQLCFIYDVVAKLLTIDASDSSLVTMPDINIETGEYDNLDVKSILGYIYILFADTRIFPALEIKQLLWIERN